MDQGRNKRIFKAALIILLGYSFVAWFSWPAVSFESSDGGWRDHEILLKDRDFQAMVYFFEHYKIVCDANEALLVRTTEINRLNIFYWPSYIADKKWKIPYRAPTENRANRACYDTASHSEEISNTAILRSREFVESL